MSHLYYDESIRESGNFIIGGLVVAKTDISPKIRDAWRDMGLNPDKFEYKSSTPKANDEASRRQRGVIATMLQHVRLGLTVCPASDRRTLGTHCAALVSQMLEHGHLCGDDHQLFVDQNIYAPSSALRSLAAKGVATHLNQDSRTIAGIQLADHAAHSLGGMLLEEMGIVRKQVRAGEDSGYDPELEIELGFELWAGLRYALIGKNEHIPGLSPDPEDPANPYFRVDGHGLYIPASCSDALAAHARARFGINYLGCIH